MSTLSFVQFSLIPSRVEGNLGLCVSGCPQMELVYPGRGLELLFQRRHALCLLSRRLRTIGVSDPAEEERHGANGESPGLPSVTSFLPAVLAEHGAAT